MSYPKVPADLRCDFCGQLESHGREMVAGPGIYICDACVDLCVEVLAMRKGVEGDQPEGSGSPESRESRGGPDSPAAPRPPQR